jgi:hypothetical protein
MVQSHVVLSVLALAEWGGAPLNYNLPYLANIRQEIKKRLAETNVVLYYAAALWTKKKKGYNVLMV